MKLEINPAQLFKCVLLVECKENDPFLILTINGDAVGAWRGEAWRWACEVLKPFVIRKAIPITFANRKAKAAWDKIQTLEQFVAKCSRS